MDFLEMIYENNVEKKTFISQQTYLYLRVADILNFYEVLFCTYCKGLFCLRNIMLMLIFLRICIKHSQH